MTKVLRDATAHFFVYALIILACLIYKILACGQALTPPYIYRHSGEELKWLINYESYYHVFPVQKRLTSNI